MTDTSNELKTLREKMLALQNGNFDVVAQNPRIVKCWERLGCEKQDCCAYGKLRCWSIAGTLCHGEVQGVFAQKLGDCRDCVVYKESCGDEIGELLEIFNQMIKEIKYRFHERERFSQEEARSERLMELGDMVAAVAHETRNPLHSIGMAASYLKKNFHGELVTEFLAIIEEEVRRLNDLTSLFLSFSHPSPLNLQPCDLNEVVAATVAICQKKLTGRDLTIASHPAAGLPAVTCDPARVQEAVSNLIANAVDVSTEGAIVIVATRMEEHYVRISVQDAGPGINPEDREAIFRPFYTTKSRGPGLGLAIVRRSLKELNGKIELDSTPGRGSTFSILLPVFPADNLPQR
jgi:two-component system, NtrC family, sensor histidine kinase HydH